MTLGKFSIFAFIQWLVLAFFKIGLLNQPPLANAGTQSLVFWAIGIVLWLALVRRFGILNYLELFFIGVVWILGDCLLDLLVTSHFTGIKLFSQVWYWLAYVFMAVAILLFHKKRHVHMRHELHAQHK